MSREIKLSMREVIPVKEDGTKGEVIPSVCYLSQMNLLVGCLREGCRVFVIDVNTGKVLGMESTGYNIKHLTCWKESPNESVVLGTARSVQSYLISRSEDEKHEKVTIRSSSEYGFGSWGDNRYHQVLKVTDDIFAAELSSRRWGQYVEIFSESSNKNGSIRSFCTGIASTCMTESKAYEGRIYCVAAGESEKPTTKVKMVNVNDAEVERVFTGKKHARFSVQSTQSLCTYMDEKTNEEILVAIGVKSLNLSENSYRLLFFRTKEGEGGKEEEVCYFKKIHICTLRLRSPRYKLSIIANKYLVLGSYLTSLNFLRLNEEEEVKKLKEVETKDVKFGDPTDYNHLTVVDRPNRPLKFVFAVGNVVSIVSAEGLELSDDQNKVELVDEKERVKFLVEEYNDFKISVPPNTDNTILLFKSFCC